MARLSRQESKHMTLDRLRQAAFGEFAVNGFAGAAIDRITDNAGYSRGAFYANYSTKEDILLDILSEQHVHELAKWRALLQQANDLDSICSGIAAIFADYLADMEQGLFVAEVQLHARRNPAFAKKYRTHLREIQATVRDLLVASFTIAGRTPPDDIEAIANLLRGLVIGLALDIEQDNALSAAESASRRLESWLRSVIDQGKPATRTKK